MSGHTRSQRLAQAAFDRISARGKPEKDYVGFAKKFPALIHTCGLAQAVAFAQAKGRSNKGERTAKPEMQYLEDLAHVVRAGHHDEINSADKLAEITRNEPVNVYLRLSRDAINAASWLKRYVEAMVEEDE